MSVDEIIVILSDVIDAANKYAAYTCSEFCVHSIDQPESCPYEDKRIKDAQSCLEALQAERMVV